MRSLVSNIAYEDLNLEEEEREDLENEDHIQNDNERKNLQRSKVRQSSTVADVLQRTQIEER